MDIQKFKENLAKMPELGFKNNMFVGKTQIIREIAKKHNLKPADAADFGKIEPVVIDESEKKVENEKLEKQIAENMARLGGSHEFWERRLTHGWDALEAKLKEMKDQGLTMEQIFDKLVKEV